MSAASGERPIERLRAAVRESGSPLADVMSAAPPGYVATGGPDPVALAASGPRVAAHRDEVELAVSAVLEGCLLHYGRPRACRSPTPTSRCSPATASTRSASRGWRRSAT